MGQRLGVEAGREGLLILDATTMELVYKQGGTAEEGANTVLQMLGVQ